MRESLRIRLTKLVARPHNAWVIRRGGAKLGFKNGYHFLVLETIGAKSGAVRKVTLLCLPKDDSYLVVASNYGSEHPPAWYFNLRKKPDVHIEVDGDRRPMHATILEGEQRTAAQAAAEAIVSPWRGYFRSTKREIPIVRLSPR